ncbi:hypothetical protein MNBD_GAMMA17-1415 [hydrothermal vent metagenome]|uniref:Tetrameric acyl-CoA thioesterase n=1 Tax=hydrothermal vent metagenome TaxID=652676 RepID=A0A3B0Z5B2_9ZZZZ
MLAQFLRKNARTMPVKLLMFIGNLWSPFRGAGIKIVKVSDDYRLMEVEMKLKWSNKNYVGTHFGGSMYAMTDPFYMMMLINNLGPKYIVWDKAARIEFKKPGKGTIRVRFEFSEEEILAIKEKADDLGKYIFDKPVDIKNESGEVVATVVKTLYVRRRHD